MSGKNALEPNDVVAIGSCITIQQVWIVHARRRFFPRDSFLEEESSHLDKSEFRQRCSEHVIAPQCGDNEVRSCDSSIFATPVQIPRNDSSAYLSLLGSCIAPYLQKVQASGNVLRFPP